MSNPPTRRQHGFTLVEVLVAVVILGIGLTGIAGLQIMSVRGGQDAYQRSQATLLAYDIIDRMRGNLIAARAGDYDTGIGEATAALALCVGIAANCSPQEFADHDRRMWRQSLDDFLPSGAGSVATAVVAGQTQATVLVQWLNTQTNLDADGTVVPERLQIVVRL